MWAVAAAAVVALIVGASWWTTRLSRDASLVAITIDLQPFAVMRGDTQLPPPAPIVVPRARLDATIVLPLGAEPGTYEVQLLDRAASIRMTATGEGEISGSVTALRVPMNTVDLPADTYQFQVRRADGDWRSAPAEVK